MEEIDKIQTLLEKIEVIKIQLTNYCKEKKDFAQVGICN